MVDESRLLPDDYEVVLQSKISEERARKEQDWEETKKILERRIMEDMAKRRKENFSGT